MRTRIVHIMAIGLTGIVTGAQYAIYFDYNPEGASASFFVEKMQFGVDHIGAPLLGMAILSIAMCFVSAVTYFRSTRTTSLLLIASGTLLFFVAVITIFGNIPQLDIIDKWSPKSPPADWLDTVNRWYWFHSARLWVSLIGFFLAITSAFTSNRLSPDRN